MNKAIQSWLLSDEVQCPAGPHRGAVAGWLDESGSARFFYPEATGYYLTWLAFLAHAFGSTESAARRANEALSWISSQCEDGRVPLTRTYLDNEGSRDWRNRGSFAFDLAMLARGVAAVRDLADETERSRVLPQVLDRLLLFCTGSGSFQAFRTASSLDPDQLSRWSCNHGPYQAKVATAVLSANTVSPIPDRLHATAASVYSRWREYSRINPLEGNHPTFYHLEGLALAAANGWDREALSMARDAYLQIVGMKEPAVPTAQSFDGSALENRSDVLAQALRMGCILRSRAGLEGIHFERTLQHLQRALCRFITEDGAVLFSLHPPHRHKNVWSSMFAHQALSFYEVIAAGNSLDDRWLQLLV